METGIPISKRALTGGGAMWLIKELNESTSEQALAAMWFVCILAVAYMIADEIRRRHEKADKPAQL